MSKSARKKRNVSPPASVQAGLPSEPDSFCDLCGIDFGHYGTKSPRRCFACANSIKQWETATNWKELLGYNREFIIGDRKSTPYSMFPIYKDKLLHPRLLHLQTYGVLVTDAQPQFETVGQHNGEWYEVKERAYLRCVLPTNHPYLPWSKIDDLIMRLLLNNGIEVVTYYEYSEYQKGEFHSEGRFSLPVFPKGIDVTAIPKFQYFFSTVGPSSAGRTVAKHRWADTKSGLGWKRWVKCKHNSLPIITEADIACGSTGKRAFGRELTVTKSMKPIIITIAAREWPPLGLDLIGALEDACILAKMKPQFARA